MLLLHGMSFRSSGNGSGNSNGVGGNIFDNGIKDLWFTTYA